jgi:hypothetical protein
MSDYPSTMKSVFKSSALKYFGLSIAFHILILGISFQFKTPEKKKEIYSIELTETNEKSKSVSTQNSKKNKSYSAVNKNRKQTETAILNSPLNKFKPRLNLGTAIKNSTGDSNLLGSEDTYETSANFDNPNADWGSGAGTFARVKDYILLKRVYDQIDMSLFFPSFFVRRNIHGVTNARLVLNAQGDCEWKKTKIFGNDAFMQIYILSVLKSACKQSFKPFIKQRQITNVDLSFHFELTEDYSKEIVDSKKFIIGNSLMFYRNAVKSLMQWEFGPFQGVFPVPAVYLNLPWIQENWDKLINHKDPISEFKREFGS